MVGQVYFPISAEPVSLSLCRALPCPALWQPREQSKGFVEGFEQIYTLGDSRSVSKKYFKVLDLFQSDRFEKNRGVSLSLPWFTKF